MSDTGRKVFVGGLDYNLTSDDVRLYFSKYGGIEDAVVLTNDRNGPFPGRSRGFGFITFNDEPSAQKVLDAAPHTLGEKTVEVKLAIPKDQLGAPSRRERGPSDGPVSDEKTSKLFVGGIRNDMTSEELMSVFQEEGAVSVDIMKDRSNGKGRGFGFVVFDNEEVVDRLAKQRMRQIGDKQVEMKKAQSVGRMRETERRDGGGGRFDDYGSRGGGGGGGPMRNNRGGFRGDRGGPGGGYRDNRGGGGGYNGGMGPGGGMPYNNSPQGWGNNLMSSMNQNFNPGFNGQMSAGGYGGMGGTAPAYNGGQNPSGGYNTNYGNYGTSSNGNYGGQNTAYPGSYGNQTYGQGQGQGQGQSQGQQADPSTAFHQLQQAVQNFVATTNQPPGSEAYPGYPQASQSNHSDNSYSGYGDQSATPPVSQRTKQAAPYYLPSANSRMSHLKQDSTPSG